MKATIIATLMMSLLIGAWLVFISISPRLPDPVPVAVEVYKAQIEQQNDELFNLRLTNVVLRGEVDDYYRKWIGAETNKMFFLRQLEEATIDNAILKIQLHNLTNH